jgi:uncharacterized protein (TIGR02271 family)
MDSSNDYGRLIGQTMYSSDHDKIGKVGQVFLDDTTGRPEFLTVNTGLFGTSESFVPAGDIDVTGDDVRVPFTKDKVKDAPHVDVDAGHLDESQEEELYRYYGLSYDHSGAGDGYAREDAGRTGIVDGGVAPEGHDTSGPTTDDAMTRSEEHLEAGTQTREAGRARLRKYVTTEQETVTVPVKKERAVLESEPITDANVGQATSGPDISEEEHEVVLNEERPVVETVAEPVERVRLGTETITDEETVSEEVRKEQIEVEGDVDRRGGA